MDIKRQKVLSDCKAQFPEIFDFVHSFEDRNEVTGAFIFKINSLDGKMLLTFEWQITKTPKFVARVQNHSEMYMSNRGKTFLAERGGNKDAIT